MDVPGCVRKVTIAPPIARFPIVFVHGLHEDKVSFDCHGGSKIAAAPTAVLRRIHLYATRLGVQLNSASILETEET